MQENINSDVDRKGQDYEVSDRNKGFGKTELNTVDVTFWKRIWICSALILKF